MTTLYNASKNTLFCIPRDELLDAEKQIFDARDTFVKISRALRGALDDLEEPDDVPAFVAAVGSAASAAAEAAARWVYLVDIPNRLAKNATTIEKQGGAE